MPTSTLQSLALSGTQYVWDGVTGILFSAGMLEFFVAMLIILGVIGIATGGIKRIFNM